MNRCTNSTLSIIIAFSILVAGCDEYQPPPQQGPVAMPAASQGQFTSPAGPSPFVAPQTDHVVMLLIDLSGSFANQMANEGKAYEFYLQIYDRFFKDRIGHDKDVLVIAQLSGTHRSLLWQGHPLQLRQQFASSSEFKEFLLSHADPNGSVIHDGIAHSLELLVSDPALVNPNTKTAVFVLSDLLDNGANPEKSGPRVTKALAEYARMNGVLGLYYVDQDLVVPWRQSLQASGMRDYRVECIINQHPDLPNFQ